MRQDRVVAQPRTVAAVAQEEQPVVAFPQPKVELVRSQVLARPVDVAPVAVTTEVTAPTDPEVVLTPAQLANERRILILNAFNVAGLKDSLLADQIVTITREYREQGKPAEFFEDRISSLFVLYDLSVNQGKSAELARKLIEFHRMDDTQLVAYLKSEKQKRDARAAQQLQQQTEPKQGFFQKAASKLAGLFSSSK